MPKLKKESEAMHVTAELPPPPVTVGNIFDRVDAALKADAERAVVEYRSAVTAVVRGEEPDAETLVENLRVLGLGRAVFESDVAALGSFPELEDCLNNFDSRLEKLGAERITVTTEIKRLEKELFDARAKHRSLEGHASQAIAIHRIANAFKVFNPRLFAADLSAAMLCKKPGHDANEVSQISATEAERPPMMLGNVGCHPVSRG